MPKATNLSENPKQIRNRLRRRGKRLNADLELYFDKQYGKPIEEWDLEELARGRPRASDGTFKGRTPSWITAAVQREAKRRLLDHTFGQIGSHVDLAIRTIVNLLNSTEVDEWGKPIVDARTKLAAAQFIIENIVGKPKAIVEVDASDTVRQFLANALLMSDDDPSPAHPVIDGQFSEDDEEDDEDDE